MRTAAHEGDAEYWDGTPQSLEHIRQLSGRDFAGTDLSGNPVLQREDHLAVILPGWAVVGWDNGHCSLHSAGEADWHLEPC